MNGTEKLQERNGRKSMSLKEKLNKRPMLVSAVMLLVIAAAVYISVSSMRPNAGRSYKPPQAAYFTSDDGKTFFVDDATKIAPFKTADGKEAVEAFVYSCDGDKDPFVAYMMRYTPEAKKGMEAAYSRSTVVGGRRKYASMQDRDQVLFASTVSAEVKQPGDSTWVGARDATKYAKVIAFDCPKGSPRVNVTQLRP